MLLLFQLEYTAFAVDRRVLVTGAGSDIQCRFPECRVRTSRTYPRGCVRRSHRSQRSASSLESRPSRHFFRSRYSKPSKPDGNSLIRNVHHDDRKMVIVDQVEVIKITSNLLCGIFNGVDVEFVPASEHRGIIQ